MHPLKTNSIIGRKSYAFALEIIRLYKYLSEEKREFVLSKQMLRSGTSIGANVNEALSGESKRDFVHKLSIALKEAKETSYWVHLLKDSSFISPDQFEKIDDNCSEVVKILTSIILTTKEKYVGNETTKTQNS